MASVILLKTYQLMVELTSLESIKKETWKTSQAEFKMNIGVLMNLNAYCGKKHCKIEDLI